MDFRRSPAIPPRRRAITWPKRIGKVLPPRAYYDDDTPQITAQNHSDVLRSEGDVVSASPRRSRAEITYLARRASPATTGMRGAPPAAEWRVHSAGRRLRREGYSRSETDPYAWCTRAGESPSLRDAALSSVSNGLAWRAASKSAHDVLKNNTVRTPLFSRIGSAHRQRPRIRARQPRPQSARVCARIQRQGPSIRSRRYVRSCIDLGAQINLSGRSVRRERTGVRETQLR